MVEAGEALLRASQLGALVLAAATARAAARAHRVSGARPLRLFALGFSGLAVAEAAALLLGLFTTPGLYSPAPGLDRYDLLFWTYYLGQLAGLALVLASFGRRIFQWTPAAAPLLQVAGPLAHFAVLLVSFFVVLHAGLNHIARARAGSLQTAVGFFLLLLGQLLFLVQNAPYSPLDVQSPLGAAVSLGGYLLLYLAVVRPRGTS